MATTAILSQGSAFYVLDNTVVSPAVVRRITQTKGITGLGGSRTIISTTNLDSLAKEKAPGLMDPGAISFDLILNEADPAHQLLETLGNTGTNPIKQWYFGLSDGGVAAPIFSGTIAGANLVLATPKNVTTPGVSGAAGASITTTVMTVTSMASGAFLVGQTITGGGTVAGTVITSFGTGSGQTGTYNVNISQTVAAAALTGAGTLNVRTGYLFNAFVKQFQRDVAADGIVVVKGALEITGLIYTAANNATWVQ